jgi:hypothetical protein
LIPHNIRKDARSAEKPGRLFAGRAAGAGRIYLEPLAQFWHKKSGMSGPHEVVTNHFRCDKAALLRILKDLPRRANHLHIFIVARIEPAARDMAAGFLNRETLAAKRAKNSSKLFTKALAMSGKSPAHIHHRKN